MAVLHYMWCIFEFGPDFDSLFYLCSFEICVCFYFNPSLFWCFTTQLIKISINSLSLISCWYIFIQTKPSLLLIVNNLLRCGEIVQHVVCLGNGYFIINKSIICSIYSKIALPNKLSQNFKSRSMKFISHSVLILHLSYASL